MGGVRHVGTDAAVLVRVVTLCSEQEELQVILSLPFHVFSRAHENHTQTHMCLSYLTFLVHCVCLCDSRVLLPSLTERGHFAVSFQGLVETTALAALADATGGPEQCVGVRYCTYNLLTLS